MAAAVWSVYCDGSAVPNPGRMGLGAVLVAPDGVTRHTISQATTATGCNNEAELRSLMLALAALRTHGARGLQIHSDSSVLVEQLGDDRPAPPIARLAPLFDEARRLLQGFAPVELRWIPRHRNGEADALARQALGLAPKAAPKPRKKRR